MAGDEGTEDEDRGPHGRDAALDLEPRRHHALPATNRSMPARSARTPTPVNPAARKSPATAPAWLPPAVSKSSGADGRSTSRAEVTIRRMTLSPSSPPSSANRGS